MSDNEELLRDVQSFLQRIGSIPLIQAYTEIQTKQGLIIPVLRRLGWDVDDITEVVPEFSADKRRVDYCLALNARNHIFLEVKKPIEDLETHQDQPLDYAFIQGIQMTVLTNGIVWMFYLSMKPVDWRSRRFFTVDVLQQDAQHAAEKLVSLLSRANVSCGRHLENAEEMYQSAQRRQAVKEGLPKAWRKILSEPDPALVELLSTTTEKLVGFTPEQEEAAEFIASVAAPGPTPVAAEPTPRRGRSPGNAVRGPRADGHISQEDWIKRIVLVLGRNGGSASKKDHVQPQIYSQWRDRLSDSYYEFTLGSGSGRTLRWVRLLEGAKQQAVDRWKLIEEPRHGRRGEWKLTELGLQMYQALESGQGNTNLLG